MKNFRCTRCGNTIYFENVQCLACGSDIGFDPSTLTMTALVPGSGPGRFRAFDVTQSTEVKYCANARHAACNWLASADGNGLCRACDLNRTIPNLAESGSLDAWRDLERAKKRLVYSLMRFGLPLGETSEGVGRLAFDFVRDATTGHQDGVITIDVLEADSVERERQRQLFGEPYRALLGHLRHESGHFYWMVLIEQAGRLDEFRALFGDERDDYGAALARHHAEGPRPEWQASFVSSYASAHPWEDWAETWAHYLHIVDAVDTADAEGMEPRSQRLDRGALWPYQSADVYRDETFAALMSRWVPLSTALNSLSRCMGHGDFYPFVLPGPAYDKLGYVHQAIRG
jgi:hypothetical protein